MIRTNLTLEELEEIQQVPLCPHHPNECLDTNCIGDYWRRCENNSPWNRLESYISIEGNLFYYRVPDAEIIFVMEWTTIDKCAGAVYNHLGKLWSEYQMAIK